MNAILTVFKKEWKCFVGSDRGVFILYAIMVLLWSFLLSDNSSNSEIQKGSMWLVFFSVVIAANFSNTVFISERVNGALEIFITSGLTRNSILFGKIAFIIIMSSVIGLLCMLLGILWCHIIYNGENGAFRIIDYLTYVSSVFMNVAGSAFLSVRMTNPRLLHFANLFLLGGIVSLYAALSSFYPIPEIILPLFLTVLGVLFSLFAKKEFNSERIIQPVIF